MPGLLARVFRANILAGRGGGGTMKASRFSDSQKAFN